MIKIVILCIVAAWLLASLVIVAAFFGRMAWRLLLSLARSLLVLVGAMEAPASGEPRWKK